MTDINTTMIATTNQLWLSTEKWLRVNGRGGWYVKRTEAQEREIEKHRQSLAAQESGLFKCYLDLFAELEKMWADSGLPQEMLETTHRLETEEIRKRKSSTIERAYFRFKLRDEWRRFSFALVTQDAGGSQSGYVLRIACDPFDNSRTLRFGVESADKIVEWGREQMQEMISHVKYKIKQEQQRRANQAAAEEFEAGLVADGYNVKVTSIRETSNDYIGHLRLYELCLYNEADLEIARMDIHVGETVRRVRINHVEPFALGGFGALDTVTLEFRGGGMPVRDVLAEALRIK